MNNRRDEHQVPRENPDPSRRPPVRYAPGIRLTAAERMLLAQAFPDAKSIFVEREFRSGYSGALVLLVSVAAGQAPVVVKLAHPHDLQRETAAYQRYVISRAPQNTARLQGDPLLAEDRQLGLIIYSFAGGDTGQPSSNLRDYIDRRGADAAVEVLNRIFRVYGRHWWANNRPHKFVLAEEYDWLLPVHLETTPAPARQDEPDLVVEGGVTGVLDLRTLAPGHGIRLRNFDVVKVSGQSATLLAPPPHGEASAPLRIRLLSGPSAVWRPGDWIEGIDVTVNATRAALLAEALPTSAGFQDWRAPLLPATLGADLPNPLALLEQTLDRVVEMRVSTIHGDLNLQNILVDMPTGFAWLIDFADTRTGPTLMDLQRLEVQVITKLLPDLLQESHAAPAVRRLLETLHADPPPARSPLPALQGPYTLLVGLRRLARQYLMDDLNWDEYHLGLSLALTGALKYAELPPVARLLALVGAATAQSRLGIKPAATQSPSAGARPAQSPPRTLTIPAPPEPARPPQITGFIGRSAELAAFAGLLEEEGVAMITGMAGVGKTALAATLAANLSRSDQLFWHSFHAGDSVDVLIRRLAAFLAWHGQDSLWRLLESSRLTGGKPPETETLTDYLLQLVQDQPYFLVLDDLHLVEDDPELDRLLQRIHSAAAQSTLRLLVTTRRSPTFAPAGRAPALAGLVLDDARLFLSSRGLVLEPAVLAELHTLTGGNAQFLNLAANILQQAADPQLLVERLAGAEDVARYLLASVDEGLSGSERAVMGAVAVLLGYPGSRDAVETVLHSGNVWRTLHGLADRHLLTVTDADGRQAQGKLYSQHAILQEFYYQELGRRQRRQMHQRAGDYYAEEEPDLLRSAIHYERAAAHALAARQATMDVWAIINRGQARILRQLLARFRADQLDPLQWAQVNVARGVSDDFLDDREQAVHGYRDALATLADLPADERVRILKARAYRGMGELLELENPAQALHWLEQGLASLAQDEPAEGAPDVAPHDPAEREEVAALHVKQGTAQLYLGRYPDAQAALERGLNLLPETPGQLRGLALMNLGSVHFFRGELPASLACYQAALEICAELNDRFRMVNILSNVGIGKYITGDWQGALEEFKQALALADELGSERLQAEVEINLGAAYINLGDDEPARHHLEASLRKARSGRLQVVEAFAQYRLADLQIRLGEWAGAAASLAKAEAIAREIGHQSSLIAILRGWADVKLAFGDQAEARRYAEESTALAAELEEELDRGESLRVLGKVLLTAGERQAALAALEESLTLLADEDPYEAARTMVVLGMALLEQAEARASTLLDAAAGTFRRFGAKRDLRDLES